MTTQKKPKNYLKTEQATVNAWPFTISRTPRSDTLVIIIHGFTSSAYEVHDMAHYLADKGIDVHAVLLAGHGGSFDYLKSTNKEDWYFSAEKVLKSYLGKYKNIFLVGYSFGANIAFHLTRNYPEIKGVASLGIPVYIRNEKYIRFFLPLAQIFRKKFRKHWVDKDQLALTATGRHRDIPIKSIAEFYSFIDNYTKKEIKEIDQPTLIIHARDDMVSDPRSSEYLYTNIASSHKTMYILNKDNHNLVHDSRRDFVFNRVYQFMDKYSV